MTVRDDPFAGIDVPSERVADMRRDSAHVRAVFGGTRVMREHGEEYLPPLAAETSQAYKKRLAASFLLNGTRKTVRDFVGRAFRVPMKLTEGAPPQLTKWAENLDTVGSNLNTFAMQAMVEGLLDGVSYVLVDGPSKTEAMSRLAAQVDGVRPRAIALTVQDVIDFRFSTIDNTPVLSHFRFFEVLTVQTGLFKSEDISRIRAFDLVPSATGNIVVVSVYQKTDDKGKESRWELVEQIETDLEFIPVVPVYTQRDKQFTGTPLLEDLADINVAHWQSQSDQRHILHVARVPILWARGVSPEAGPIEVGSQTAHVSSDENFMMGFAEHSGQAIGAGRNDLKDLEFMMEALGMQLLVQRVAGQSAAGEILDAGKETTQIVRIIVDLKDAMSQVLAMMLYLDGQVYDASAEYVVANTEHAVIGITEAELNGLIAARANREISHNTFIAELKRRGFLASEVSAASEWAAIQTELKQIQKEDPDVT